MVVKKKITKEMKELKSKKSKAVKEEVEEDEGGTSLDDAFADDSGVEYAESKPTKVKKKGEGLDDEELEEELDEVEEMVGSAEVDREDVQVKSSKPVGKVKKGDKIKIDGVEYTVDAHYVLIKHPSNNEMAIEIFNPKTDMDYQVRYFDDNVEATIDFYELQGEIMFVKKPFKKIEW
jgi:hypothetical protein